jgi:hypothetical protein
MMNQVLLLHDSARQHPSLLTREVAATMGWTVLPCPPFSPHLAPSDLHIFGPLRDALRGRRFADDDELKHSVRDELRRFGKVSYTTGIQRLTQRWNMCVDNEGEFVEKQS